MTELEVKSTGGQEHCLLALLAAIVHGRRIICTPEDLDGHRSV